MAGATPPTVGGWVEGLERRVLLSVSAIPGGSFGTQGSSPRQFLDAGDAAYFTTTAGPVLGLWKTDGTGAGTVLLKDFGSTGNAPQLMTRSGPLVYFTAGDAATGRELWKTDGTAAGTALVADVRPGTGASFIDGLTDVNGVLYFSAGDGATGQELWRSDGTAAGTRLVADIVAGVSNSTPTGLVNFGGTLYFVASGTGTGRELWASDGTAAGTRLVKDVLAGTGSSAPSSLTVVGNTLYFAANDGTSGAGAGGIELWKTDGTTAGTARVKDVRPGTASSAPAELTAVGDTLYFTANDGSHGVELWKSNGTDAGTVLVKDLSPLSPSATPTTLRRLGDGVVFTATDGTGVRVWRSDGTAAGTVALSGTSPSGLTVAAGRAFFAVADPAAGTELWSSDGTPAGTALVADLNPLAPSANPTAPAPAFGGTRLLFAASDGFRGEEPFLSDGTAAGTRLVADVNATAVAATATTPFAAGGRLYYSSTAGGLYAATAAGVVAVAPGLRPTRFAAVDDVAYFAATDAAGKPALYRTDGTTAGTSLVRSFVAGGSVGEMAAVGGLLYFAAPDAAAGVQELWQTDGTPAGTVRVVPGTAASRPVNPLALTTAAGTLHFYASDAAHGAELWKTDGTAASTVPVADVNPGAGGSAVAGLAGPALLVVGGGAVVFPATATGTGADLWRTDGTPAGTYLLKAGVQIDATSFARTTAASGGRVYFLVGGTLWATDGTAAGTAAVAAIESYDPTGVVGLTAAGGAIFVVDRLKVTATVYGEFDLWRSDGTPGGTGIVKRFSPTTTGGTPGVGPLTAVGQAVYFVGWNGADGAAQLWEADAAAPVAFPLGGATADAVAPVVAGTDVYFFANGTPWRATTTAAAPAAPTGLTATASGPYSVNLAWADPAGDETGFLLDRSTAADFPAAATTTYTLAANTTTYADEVLDPLTRYDWRVRAFNGAGASATTAAADATTAAEPSPTPGDGVPRQVDAASDWIPTSAAVSFQHRTYIFGRSPSLGVTALLRTDGSTFTPILAAATGNSGALTVAGGRLYFLAAGKASGTAELWVTDGSAAGSRFLKAVTTSAQLFVLDGRVYFPAANATTFVPWVSDGTPAGTVPAAANGDRRVDAIMKYRAVLSPQYDQVVVGDLLYYTAPGSNKATQVWRSDGTDAGTVQLSNFVGARPYAAGQYYDTPSRLGVAYGSVYFSSAEAASPTADTFNFALWKSDGTVAGTVRVAALTRNPLSVGQAAGGRYFFTDSLRLWASDGTAAGTVMLKEFPFILGVGNRSFGLVAGLADRAYVVVREVKTDDGRGVQTSWGRLWTSDGTEAGTVEVAGQPPQVQDVTRSHYPDLLSAVGGALYYSSDPAYATDSRLYRIDPAPSTDPAPPAPTDLAATVVSGVEAVLAWTDNAGSEVGYRVERSRDAGFGTVDATVTLGPSSTRYVDAGLTPGTTYYYRVRAFGAGGDSAAAIVGPVTTHVGPAAPTGLTAVNAVPGEAVDLAWTDNSADETAFVVQRSSSPAFDPPALVALTVNLPAGTTAYRDTTVSRLTTYYYRVYAVGAGGNSAPAKAVIATPESRPYAPAALTAAAVAGDEIDLAWQDVSPNEAAVGGYRVERAGADGAFAEIAQLPANSAAYADDFVPAYGTYTYRVRAVNAVGASDYAAVAAVPLPPLTTPVARLPAVTDTSVPFAAAPTTIFGLSTGVGLLGARDARGRDSVYATDGTVAGTTYLRQLQPILDPAARLGMVELNGVAYFIGVTYTSSQSLWRSDGTPAGTYEVSPGLAGASGGAYHDLTVAGGRLYFGAGGASGALWASDGTAAGTVKLKDFGPGNTGPRYIAGAAGTVFFSADSPDHTGFEPWTTDGTAAGTRMLLDIAPGGGSQPADFVNFNGKAYFSADDTVHGHELWVSDGTAAGTAILADLTPTGGQGLGPYALRVVGDEILFADFTGIWRSDGTAAGTTLVKQTTADPADSAAWPSGFTPLDGGRLLFTTTHPIGASQSTTLWVTDGSAAGTMALTYQAWDANGIPTLDNYVGVGNSLFYSVRDATNGTTSLFETAATPGGTSAVRTFTGPLRNFSSFAGKLYFSVGVPDDSQLWRSDGTAAGTYSLPFVFGTYSTYPDWVTTVGATTFFVSSYQEGRGTELWRTDGTSAGTARLLTGTPSGLVNAGGTLYFANGAALWKSDGTAGGTVKVADLPPGSVARPLAAANGRLLFGVAATAGAAADGRFALWSTELATGATTSLGLAVYLYPVSGSPPQYAVSGGYFYFLDGANGNGSSPDGGNLWRTDGTPAGTARVNNLTAVTVMADVGGTLYVVAFDPTDSLYKVAAGSPSATLVKAALNPVPGFYHGMVANLADAGGTLYFTAPDEGRGFVVWKSDGTAAGTVPVFDPLLENDVTPVAARPYGYTALGGAVYFFALDHYTTGTLDKGNLWRTDGTAAGTTVVRALAVNNTNNNGGLASPVFLTTVAGKLVYGDGEFLWRSDGTRLGTVRIDRIGTATDGSRSPATFVGPAVAALGDSLIYSAAIPGGGREVRVANLTPPVAPDGLTVSDGGTAAGVPAGTAGAAGGRSLAWADRSGNESGFVLDRSTSADFASIDRTVFLPADATAYADATAAAGTAYYYRLQAVNAGGASGFATAAIGVPVVQGWLVNDGSPQRSMVTGLTVTFDTAVLVDAGAFVLAGRGGAGAGVAVSAANPSADGRTWVLTFAGPGVVGGGLPDGVYDLRVVAAKVSAAGADAPAMAADAVVTFHRLFGDYDGNGTVNNADNGRFRNAFGSTIGSPAYNPIFDYDGNGTINNADNGQFRNRFGTTLAY